MVSVGKGAIRASAIRIGFAAVALLWITCATPRAAYSAPDALTAIELTSDVPRLGAFLATVSFDVSMPEQDVILQLVDNTGFVHTHHRKWARAERTSVTFTANINHALPEGLDYALHAYLVPRGDDTSAAVSTLSSQVTVAGDAAPMDTIIAVSTPPTLATDAQGLTATVQYSTSGEPRRIIVMLRHQAGGWFGSAATKVTGRAGIVTLPITLRNDPEPGDGYFVRALLVPRGSGAKDQIHLLDSTGLAVQGELTSASDIIAEMKSRFGARGAAVNRNQYGPGDPEESHDNGFLDAWADAMGTVIPPYWSVHLWSNGGPERFAEDLEQALADIEDSIGTPSDHTVQLLVRPFPNTPGWTSEDPNTDRLGQIAEGAFDDDYWIPLRDGLLNAPQAVLDRLFIRWGHEFNGSWNEWRITDGRNYVRSIERETQFRDGWRHVHDIVMSEVDGLRSLGKTLAWDWNPSTIGFLRTGEEPLNGAYPGDEYVDIVAIDIYRGPETPLSLIERWRDAQPSGPLGWLTNFAVAHGLLTAIDETNVRVDPTSDLGKDWDDDADFYQELFDWQFQEVKAGRHSHIMLFDNDPFEHLLVSLFAPEWAIPGRDPYNFPASRQRVIELWGN